MAEYNLEPGSKITVTLDSKPSEVPSDIDVLIRETRGMFAGGSSMAEELIQDGRDDERRFNCKW
jgi:hypothetical protein